MSLETRISDLATAIGNDVKEIKNWAYYVNLYSVEPTTIATLPNGEVLQYTLDSVTRYRFVPTIYNPTQDAFYANFDGVNLTNLITKRG